MNRFIRSILPFVNNIPLVLQYEVVECGAASLSMIFRFYGLYLPLSELRDRCGVSRDGSNLFNIKNAAEFYGFTCNGVQASTEALISTNDCFPCIGWWDKNHFIVIESVSSKGAWISDPAKGRYQTSIEEFEKHFSGILLLLSPNDKFKPGGAVEREFNQFFSYLLSYPLTLVVLATLTLAILPPRLIEAGLSGEFVSEFIQNRRFGYGIPIAWLTLFISLLFIAFRLLKASLVRRVSLQLTKRLTVQIAQKLFSVDYKFYSSRMAGDIAERLGLGSVITSNLFSTFTPRLFELVSSFLIAPFVVLISWQLSLVTIGYLLVSSIISLLVTRSTLNTTRVMDIESAKHGGLLVRLFQDFRTIKACNLNNKYISEILGVSSPMLKKSQQINFRVLKIGLFTGFIGSVYEYGTISLAALLVVQGEINLAGFMAFQTLRGYLTAPIQQFTGMIQDLQSANASLGRLTDLNSAPNDPNVRSLSTLNPSRSVSKTNPFYQNQASGLLRPPLNQAFLEGGMQVKCDNVYYRFSSLADDILKGINFSCRPGTMTTVVGASGSGKSTLMKLLAGLYKNNVGTISYDERLWLEYSDNLLRNSIGYVGQETGQLRATMFENISLFATDISRLAVQDAVDRAQLSEIVATLPQGLDTELLEGGFSLSGGQIQRMAIARALVRNPSLLILDEATSSLDVPTEKQILKNIRQKQQTVVCVAHRLLSAEMSDQVIVLDQGQIMEIGDPQVLKSNPNSAYSLLLSQDSTYTLSNDSTSSGGN